MALEKHAPAILILNGVSFTLWSDYVYIESVKEDLLGSLSLMVNPESSTHEIGSPQAISNDPTPKKGLLLGKHRQSRLQVRFSVENKGYGAFITDLLNPLLQLSRSYYELPCQLIYGSYVMTQGYLEQYHSQYITSHGRVSYHLQFVKDPYILNISGVNLVPAGKVNINF